MTPPTERSNASRRGRSAVRMLLGFGCVVLVVALLAPFANDGGTPPSPGLQAVYVTVFWATLALLAVAWCVLAVVLVRLRLRRPIAAPTDRNLLAELAWTLAPAVLVLLITVPTVRGALESGIPAAEAAVIPDTMQDDLRLSGTTVPARVPPLPPSRLDVDPEDQDRSDPGPGGAP